MPVVPLALVMPGSTGEVSEVLQLAGEHGVPVVARGSGTGLSGAAVPVADGILLAFDRMKRIREIDTENQVAVVEPGVTLEQLNGELAPLGLIYPVSPGEQSGSLGGNVATNAGGMRAVRYGVTRHHVLGLEVVLADGTRAAHRREVRQVLERLRPDPAAHRLRGDAGHHDRGDREAPAPVHRVVDRPGTLRDPRRRWPRPCHTSCTSGINPSILEYVDVAGDGRHHPGGRPRPRRPRRRQGAHPRVPRGRPRRNGRRPGRGGRRTAWPRCSEELGAARRLRAPADLRRAQLIAARERAFFVGKAAGVRRPHRRGRSHGRPSPTTWPGWPSWRQEHGAFVTGCGHIGDGNVHITVFQPDDERRHAAHARELRAGARRRGRDLGRARHRDGEAALLPRDGRIRCRSSSCAPSSGPSTPRGILGPGPAARASTRGTGATLVNGARALLSTLVDAGVDVCFANPGTSEMHFVAALDDVPAMRGVLCLFEGVVTGAADGYGRVAGRPAATLLHLGPGPRQRAGQPAQRTAGPHADRQHRGRPRHLPRPLRRAPPVGHRVHRRPGVGLVPLDARGPTTWRPTPPTRWRPRMGPPGCVATLVLPADASWSESTDRPVPATAAEPGDAWCRPTRSTRSPRPCARGERAALLLGGSALRADGLHAASRVATHDGRRAPRRDLPRQPRARGGHPGGGAAGLPGRDGPGPARRRPAPRPGRRQRHRCPSSPTPTRRATWSPPGCTVHTLARPGEDAAGALAALAEAVGAPADGAAPAPRRAGLTVPTGALTTETLAAAVGATLPEGTIVVDEGNTSGLFVPAATAGSAATRLADAHRWRHRHRAADGDRGRGGRAGAARAVPAGRRQRHVHAAGAVDPGPRGART